MQKFVVIALLSLVLLSGCVGQELTTGQRQKCIELSSGSYASVPTCNSQQQCFEKVESEFFGFEEGVFNPRVREEIFTFKNRLAASWLYFNRSRKNAVKINEICSTGRNISGLPAEINELNHYLRLALFHSSNAFEHAFSAMALEAHFLEQDEVELISEEPVFEYLVELNKNFSELEAGSGESFAAHYFRNSEKLSALVARTGFSRRIIEEKNLLDLLDGKMGFVSKEMQKRLSLKIPFLGTALDSFVSYLNSTLKLRQASLVLPEFPSFEFFISYNDFAGTQNSSARRFSALLFGGSSAKSVLAERNAESRKSISEKLALIESAISNLSPKASASLDQNFAASLYSLLGKESSIEAQHFGINSLSDFEEKAGQELLELKARFNSIRQKALLGELSLGAETLALKETLADANELLANIDYLSSEVVEGAILLCEQRISQVNKTISSISGAGTAIADLKARIRFKAEKFGAAGDVEKMLLCRDVLFDFQSLLFALENVDEFNAMQLGSLGQCTAKANSLLSNEVAGVDFGDLRARLNSINAIPASAENAQMLNGFCEALERDIGSRLNQSRQARELVLGFEHCVKLFHGLELVSSRFPESVSEKAVSKYSERIGSLEKYFSKTGLKAETALPVFASLAEQVEIIEGELEQSTSNAVDFAISKSFSVSFFPRSIPVLGETVLSKARLVIENPLPFPVEGMRSIRIPFKATLGEIVSFPPHFVSAGLAGEELVLVLDSLPVGFTVVDFDSELQTSFLESTELVSANQDSALFKKTISTELDGLIPRVLVKSVLAEPELEVSNPRIYLGGQELEFSKNKNEVSFLLDGLGGKQSVIIFYSIERPILVNAEVVESKQISGLRGVARIRLSLTNRLSTPLEKVQIKVPLELEGKGVKVRELTDASGKKQKFELLSGNNLSLWFDSLPPKSEVVVELVLEFENSEAYWLEQLNSQKSKAESLSLSINENTAGKAGAALEELNLLGELFFEKKQLLDDFYATASKLDRLEAEENSFIEDRQQFFLLKQAIESELEDVNEKLGLLKRLGFSKEASEIKTRAGQLQQSLLDAGRVFETNPANAIELLFKAQSIAPLPVPEAEALLSGEKNSVSEKVAELFGLAKSLGLKMPPENEFVALDSAFEAAISSNDLVKAKQALDNFSLRLAGLSTELNESAAQENLAVAEKIAELELLAGSVLNSRLVLLASLVESVGESELINARYVLPISRSRLKAIALELESLGSPLVLAKFSEFMEAHNRGEQLEALSIGAKFSRELFSMGEKALALDLEIGNALEIFEQDALTSFNAAAAKLNAGNANPAAIELLGNSETQLRGGNFLKSIVLSRNAVSFTSLPGSGASLYAIPLIAAVVLIAAVRFGKGKKAEHCSRKLERVASVWDD